MRWLLKRFQLSPHAYYNYRKERKAAYYKRKEETQSVIKDIYHRYNGKMGYRMVQRQFSKEGQSFSLITVHKYMKELSLRSIVYKRKPSYLRGKPHKVFPNILNQDFSPSHTGQRWCADFTYIRLSNGRMRYNCSILDLKDRSIVATKTASYITSDLAIETLQQALDQHSPTTGLILHSDQGVQFTSKAFIHYCEQNGIKQSMSKAGCPYDNAPMEFFFGKLKNGHLHHYVIKNDEHLNNLITDYIFRYYQHVRPHSALGGKAPMEARLA
ncbi:IS3 family transposase [Mechercharimyces sp. CAU 1602]|uniref:IS3 family transposase n=1 Tax=Mechercharimyces sp. CAU 1602 TaxID=2973933 RepID=UPI0021636AD1|nr:IS3 family transposase [Mechercharimyces sp. CAU 1602]MCS1351341.1 IS3 family transposase [Mechercharimyces sp. CAU 1602]